MLQRFSPLPVVEQSEEEQGFDLREALSFAWRHWKFIGSVVGVTLLIAMVYVLKQTPVYTATAQVLLEPPKQSSPASATPYQDIVDLTDAMIANQLAIIKSTEFLRRVVQKEQLVSDAEFGSRSPQAAQESTGAAAAATPEKSDIAVRELASTGALMGAVAVQRIGEGSILAISVTSVDPKRAARLANAVADAYIVEKLDARFDAAKRASAWLGDRLVELRKQLHNSEEAVAKFRADHGLVQSGTNITLSQQQLQDLNAKLGAVKTELAETKARADLLHSIEQKGGSIQSIPGLPVSSTLQTLRQQEAEISQKVADLKARYSERHPLVVNADAQHRDIERAITAEMQRMAANVDNDYQLAKAREAAVEAEFRQATGQSGTDDRTAIALRELERTAAVDKTMFEDFLQKSKIAEDQTTFQVQDARVITPAGVPGGPSSPNKSRTITMALVIGLLLGVGGAFAKEQLNSGFTTPRQAEEMLRLPVLSSVSTMTTNDITLNGKTIEIPRYVAAMPLSRFSESIRALRSGIQMTDVDNPPKVIQLTSTVPNEGKTTIALSLAISAATSGLKVVFIDADLRHSSGSRFFGMLKEPGLVDMLLAEEVNKFIKFNKELKLWVVAAGCKTQNPTDMLDSERMHHFLERCREAFDLVVIDTPPVGPVVDPFIVSQLVDKVVYVIRWASTARELVDQSIKRFSEPKKVAGVVFNRVDENLAQKYGKHASQYYYGTRDYKKYYQG
jgi:succinoglycan biosynthesis transport protein ExoP